MSIKRQGVEFNRTIRDFFPNADFGAFNTAIFSIVLPKSDSGRKLYTTGFSLLFQFGFAGDVDPGHVMQVGLFENEVVSAESTTTILPDKQSSLLFLFGEQADKQTNQLREQFDRPFPLQSGVNYSFVALLQHTIALVAAATVSFTVFGFEENEFDRSSYYQKPR